MTEAVVEWSIRNRFLVIPAAPVVGVWGTRADLTMPADAIPGLSENQGVVSTDRVGRSPRGDRGPVSHAPGVPGCLSMPRPDAPRVGVGEAGSFFRR